MGTHSSLDLPTLAREYTWRYDLTHGVSLREIAQRAGVSVSRVRAGLDRMRALEGAAESRPLLRADRSPNTHLPRLVPLFPITPLTPRSVCAHHVAIPEGTDLCCMVCHQSGHDGHPGLRRDPRTDPKPEPKPSAAAAEPSAVRRETRRSRRRRLFSAAPPGGQGETAREAGPFPTD